MHPKNSSTLYRLIFFHWVVSSTIRGHSVVTFIVIVVIIIMLCVHLNFQTLKASEEPASSEF